MLSETIVPWKGTVPFLLTQKSGQSPSLRSGACHAGKGKLIVTRCLSLGSLLFLAVLGGCTAGLFAVEYDTAVLPLLTRSFLHGRDYFVLGSGRTKMIVQADKADLAPAFVYLLFDGDDYRQSKDKQRSFGFAGGQGMVNSALEVIIGGHPFTALGHETETRWTQLADIPAVAAVWWAGGLRVTEHIFALAGKNAFVRRITLASVNLAGPEAVTLRLSLPPDNCVAQADGLARRTKDFGMAIGVSGQQPRRILPQHSALEIGPVTIAPGESKVIITMLSVRPGPAVGTSDALTDLSSERRLRDAVALTRDQWAASSSLDTGDAVVEGLFDSVRCGLPGMVSDNGVADYGMLEYGSQVARDASNTMLGLLHLGQFERARAGFEHILKNMVQEQGAAMIDNKFDEADREELDQMGEIIHALKAYRDWTGDDSLIRRYRAKLLALIERPLQPAFCDATGLVHNRREFWERTLADGYETAYQTYMVLGLRDAAELAEPLAAQDRAGRWRAAADRILQAMLEHPQCALVRDGHLIKRCSRDGRWARTIPARGVADDVPGKTERVHLADPNATLALPIAYGLIDPRSDLAHKTFAQLEGLWNARWSGGGYGRYNPSGEWDQPGPWPFATCFLMRAQHEAGMLDRSRRALQWLYSIPGGRTGAWPEEIPVIRSTESGILPWNAAEVALFIVRHWLGVRFEGQRLVLRPAIFPHTGPASADLRFRKGRLKLQVPPAGPIEFAEIDGRRVKADGDGAMPLPADFAGGMVVLHAR